MLVLLLLPCEIRDGYNQEIFAKAICGRNFRSQNEMIGIKIIRNEGTIAKAIKNNV